MYRQESDKAANSLMEPWNGRPMYGIPDAMDILHERRRRKANKVDLPSGACVQYDPKTGKIVDYDATNWMCPTDSLHNEVLWPLDGEEGDDDRERFEYTKALLELDVTYEEAKADSTYYYRRLTDAEFLEHMEDFGMKTEIDAEFEAWWNAGCPREPLPYSAVITEAMERYDECYGRPV